MCGMKASAKTANDPNSRINKALRKWNCNCGKKGQKLSGNGLRAQREKLHFKDTV